MKKLKKCKLKHQDIARMFDYSSEYSFNSSSSKQRILKGIEKIITHIEDEIAEYLSK